MSTSGEPSIWRGDSLEYYDDLVCSEEQLVRLATQEGYSPGERVVGLLTAIKGYQNLEGEWGEPSTTLFIELTERKNLAMVLLFSIVLQNPSGEPNPLQRELGLNEEGIKMLWARYFGEKIESNTSMKLVKIRYYPVGDKSDRHEMHCPREAIEYSPLVLKSGRFRIRLKIGIREVDFEGI